MAKTTWRDDAERIAVTAWEDGMAMGLEGAVLREFVSRRYPFGPRRNHPYKVWLDVVRKLMRRGLLPTQRGRRPEDLPGQLNFLSEGDGNA